MDLRVIASRGLSFSLGSPCASTALVMLKYAGQMAHRPHLEISLTARTAESATTHSLVQRRQPSPLTSPKRLFRQRAASTCQRSEEHTSELQSLRHLVCRLLLE